MKQNVRTRIRRATYVWWPIVLAVAIAVALAAVNLPVEARETTLEYELPDSNCDGTELPLEEIQTLEIYISAGPIPASDLPCPEAPGQVDTPPESFSELVQTGDLTGSVIIDLFAGPYFARARVQKVDGEWSNFSGQIELQVPGPSRPPVLLRWNLGG